MGISLLVYTKEPERYPSDDITFTLDGKGYVFSPRKDNRLMFLDSDTARGLMQAYPGTFTLWASYEGAAFHASASQASIDKTAMVMANLRTPSETRRAYNSFREFYPTMKAYIVDNGSNDSSTEYIRNLDAPHTTAILNPYNYGHGPAIHQAAGLAAAQGYTHLFSLDSDTVMQKGGIVEAMIRSMGNGYAIGKLYHTDENGFVNNSERGVRYIHPAAMLFSLAQYAMISPFSLHGAPCINNMIDAQLRGLGVVSFTIEDYLHHFGTVTVQAVNLTEVNMAYLFVQRPPLVSFIVRYDNNAEMLKRCIDSIMAQTDADYEIVPISGWEMLSSERPVICRVRGLYMYIIDASSVLLDTELVATVRQIARDNLTPNIIIVKTVDESGAVSPSESAWKAAAIEGTISYRNLIERRELWMTSTINFGGRWYNFETVNDSFHRHDWPKFHWLDKVIVRING